jgi:hypothetical protein
MWTFWPVIDWVGAGSGAGAGARTGVAVGVEVSSIILPRTGAALINVAPEHWI